MMLATFRNPRPARRCPRAVGLVLAVLLLLPAATRADAVEPVDDRPSQVIDGLHEALLGAMKEADTLGYDGRYDRLEPVVERTFDLDFMASKAVGRHWRQLSPEEQQRLRDVFGRFTLSTYASRFSGYSGERFEIRAQQTAPRDTVFVRTALHRTDGEPPVEINYRLREVEGEWRIIDVLLRGTVSELALRRSEYSSVIKRDGFAALLESLEEKITEMKAGKSDEGAPS